MSAPDQMREEFANIKRQGEEVERGVERTEESIDRGARRTRHRFRLTIPGASDEVPASPDLTAAADWLRDTPRSQRGPAVPELQRRFGLSAVMAVEIIRARNLELARAH
ncbi:hypothetical protein ACSBOB_14695 [Mesorhizobium sp. ASY16-5R]|uniref:hypothetical protein n=1 Tax=Mesorhizobium sp. ASY16-5R TaxID=3445772 RepID=UPI003FA12A29